jgi:hypothetical protein
MLNRRLLEMAAPVPDGAVMHDWWLMLVAGVFGHIGHVGQATMFYRQHDNNQVGASVSSFWEKLFSPRRKLQLAVKIYRMRYARQNCSLHNFQLFLQSFHRRSPI